ncbi:hypothetical protein [Niveibacterium sp. COAC-50]|uniref:hypothetical protein n=1 Tax=Niveibacterium sp. COAC-50 TaxID=2729384 RepID=UPI001554FB50|nr:hypothetical protein [Niveibacterium sp. COAC-50]
MKRGTVIAVALSAFLAGGVVLGLFSMHISAALIAHAFEARVVADAKSRLALLKALDENQNAEAAKQVNILLDGDIIAAAAALKERGTDSALESVLRETAERRQRDSYVSPDPTVASAVKNALSQVDAPALKPNDK